VGLKCSSARALEMEREVEALMFAEFGGVESGTDAAVCA
jgi:hypothetical protein